MKRLIFTFGVIGAGLCVAHAAHAATTAECFASPSAVFAAHPNAAHASYTLRAKRSARCWYADAFKTEAKAKAKAKPPPGHLARSSPPRPAIAAPPPIPRATTVAPPPWPRAVTVPSAPLSRTTAVAPRAPPVTVQFPGKVPPAIEMSVNVQELTRLLPIAEKPADFESRFSASGYKVTK